MEKKYLGLFNGKRRAVRGATNYQPRDDGSHIYTQEDYYEWWYFDASFDNGYHAVITYHYMNVFLKPIMPTVQVMIYKPDGTQAVRFGAFGKDEIFASPEYCDVKMGDSWARDTGDGYEVYMKIKGVGAHLTFKNVVPSWKPGTSLLFNDKEKGLVGGWVVPVPHGEVEGELFLKEETIQVKGSGYHDHNWGNCCMYEFTDSWYWGRVHTDKYAIDYGWVMPREKGAPVISPLLIAKPGEIVLSTDMMHTELQDIMTDETTGKEYAKKLTITSDVEGVKLQLVINSHRVVESIKLPPAADWDQYYLRFLADYELDIDVDGEKDNFTGELLHEYMIL